MEKIMKNIAFVMSLTTIISSSAALSASAANIGDTALPSKFIVFTTFTNTPSRAKKDTTSVYMYNQSGMNPWVYTNAGTSPGANADRLIDQGLTVGGHAVVPTGQYKIRNLIRENGYTSAWRNISTAVSGVSGIFERAMES